MINWYYHSFQVPLRLTLSIFVTTNTEQAQELSPSLRHLFRNIDLAHPDEFAILRSHFAAQGFKTIKVLAEKTKTVADICTKQL